MMPGDTRPIGVFDSGLGGLTVVKAIRRLLPGENLLYCGDTARVPYGSKSITVIQGFALDIVSHLERSGVKLVVVACNTASAVALDAIRQRTGLPVIGVIEPGVRAAIRHSRGGRVGVIGTRATVRAKAYQRRLQRLRADLEIVARACPLLVPIVEEDLIATDIARLTLEHYLADLRNAQIDTLILGCTHYPLLHSAIAAAMPGVMLVDSAEETARETLEVLRARRIEASSSGPGVMRFQVSDDPSGFAVIGERFLGAPMPEVELIPDWSASHPTVATPDVTRHNPAESAGTAHHPHAARTTERNHA